VDRFGAEVLGGKPVIRGTRISVQFVLELLASGATQAEVLEKYSHIPTEGLAAAIQYAADALKGEHIWSLRVSA
jgi:uncharacterized protein (DUF433 family)